MKQRALLFAALAAGLLVAMIAPGGEKQAAAAAQLKTFSVAKGEYVMTEEVIKSAADWKKILSPEQFRILRKKGTERAFSGQYWNNHAHGVYQCAGCGLDLFGSEDKFESGTGWPSYTRPVAPENISTEPDNSLFTRRTEVLCRRCGGHLGHVFDDGPQPTGKRYCINSGALNFVASR